MSAGGGRRRHKGGHDDDHEEHMDERWLVSFADMMTLMFALFMVLFSISSVNTSKFESLQRAMDDAFSGAVLKGGTAMLEAGQNSEAPERSAPQPPIPAMMSIDKMHSSVSPGQTPSQAKASAAAAQKEDEDFQKLKQRVDQLALNEGLRGKVDTQVRRRGLVIRLVTDDVFFASGQAQLKPRAFGLLTKIGTLIARERNHPVVVEGYTDSQPIHSAQYPSNYELSGARAGAVIQHFRGVGLNPRRMSGAMYADRHPVATNSTPEGRAKNRRVEVVLARLHNP